MHRSNDAAPIERGSCMSDACETTAGKRRRKPKVSAPPESKNCPKCGITKPQCEFHRCRYQGIRSACKACEKARKGTKRKGQVKQQQRRQARAAKSLMLEKFGKVCACCGESRPMFLCLDHKHGDGSEHREFLKQMRMPTGGQHFYKLIVDTGSTDDFQVLCLNCNFAKGKDRICPHELERRAEAESYQI